MSSFEASADCTLLMMASSAARCSLCLKRRCVSSKRRAFSSATPMLAATVLRSASCASAKANSRSWSSSTTIPSTRRLPIIGTAQMEWAQSVPGTAPVRPAATCSARVLSTLDSRPSRIFPAGCPGPNTEECVGRRLPCS